MDKDNDLKSVRIEKAPQHVKVHHKAAMVLGLDVLLGAIFYYQFFIIMDWKNLAQHMWFRSLVAGSLIFILVVNKIITWVLFERPSQYSKERSIGG